GGTPPRGVLESVRTLWEGCEVAGRSRRTSERELRSTRSPEPLGGREVGRTGRSGHERDRLVHEALTSVGVAKIGEVERARGGFEPPPDVRRQREEAPDASNRAGGFGFRPGPL